MGRPKLNRIKLEARVNQDTPKLLKQLALSHGYQYGGDGSTGAFLDAIATGAIKLTPTSVRED